MPRAPKDPSAPKKARTPRKKAEAPPEILDEAAHAHEATETHETLSLIHI